MIWPRLTALNQYLIVDEADRWLWAKDFAYALSQGHLAGTLIGHGYPGVVPAWAESIWIFGEAARRSVLEGQWIGEPGLYLLFHQWDRAEFLSQQRLPLVILNTVIALSIVWQVWRLFGKKVALLGGLLIALDPFYLSDSRLNRSEALITGLMTLSVLALIFYGRRRRFRYVLISGVWAGLSWLTKIQALVLLPAVAVIALWLYADDVKNIWQQIKHGRAVGDIFRPVKGMVGFGAAWVLAAGLTWLIVWPAMWVAPGQTLAEVYDYATHMSGAEGANVFFLGETYQDADPGFLFYPLVFLLRITPLALLGLVGAGVAGLRRQTKKKKNSPEGGGPTAKSDAPEPQTWWGSGSAILAIYIVVYALSMSFGSHKQDRYLLPIFLSVDILAAIGLVYFWLALKLKLQATSPGSKPIYIQMIGGGLLAGLGVLQIVTVLPHHPYYFSYFNPLFGGGQTAERAMRIGWGEGMDQVGAYLASKPNSAELVVSSRFTHNMLGFKGELFSLGTDGRWTRADYIVLYIQQVQRRLDPSPGFLDYFQARTPEKVITLGGIDYAWIYPIPFSTPANPQVSVIPGQAALFGYSWENKPAQTGHTAGQASGCAPRLRLLWENQGLSADRQLAVRLVGSGLATAWTPCPPDPAFITQARAPGDFVESLCRPDIAKFSPGTYTVEFGLAPASFEELDPAAIEVFPFPAGWHAARLTAGGQVQDTPELERFDAIAGETIPPPAHRLDRVYAGRLRLAAYQLAPPEPRPGDTLTLTLYWQPVKDVSIPFNRASNTDSWRTDYYEFDKEISKPVRLTVQLADSRSISLGRLDAEPPVREWLLGEVITTTHRFELAPDLETPLAARIEVTLLDEAEIPMPATTLAGEKLEAVLALFTIAPAVWLEPGQDSWPENWVEVGAAWQNGINLKGCSTSSPKPQPGETLAVNLFWETNRPLAENYVVFVHLVDEAGQIKTQHDGLPRAGAYPTPWWPPGRTVDDGHALVLPEDLPEGRYQLVVGLYRQEDGVRLPLADGTDSVVIGLVEVTR